MAPFAFLPNLFAFLLGQAAAWYYLRTGRTWVGGLATLVLWSSFDAWLLARYVYAADGATMRGLAALLQAFAVGLALRLAQQMWRRSRSSAARARSDRFRTALGAYLRSDWPAAEAGYRGLVRTDPWDAAAWLGLGDVLSRQGKDKAARRCWRRAEGVDAARAHADALQLRRTRRAAS